MRLSVSTSSTKINHPLSSKRSIIIFPQNSAQHAEVFELPLRYEPVAPISRGTFGFVIACRDARLVESFEASSKPEEMSDEEYYDSKTLVAIKKVPRIFEEGISRKWLCASRELQMMLHFKHDNVIIARDVFIPLGETNVMNAASIEQRRATFEDIYVVMRKMDYTLQEVLQKRREGSQGMLGRDYRGWILFQILRGVGFLHRCNVTHRDLKPDNILVNSDYHVCIIDFGQGRDVPGSLGSNETDSGSPKLVETLLHNCTQWYAAPETLTLTIKGNAPLAGTMDKNTLQGGDIWAVGCIAAEMLIGRPLFCAKPGGHQQLRSILETCGKLTVEDIEALTRNRNPVERDEYTDLIRQISANAPKESRLKTTLDNEYPFETEGDVTIKELEIDLIFSMLQYDPQRRASAEQLLKHPFWNALGYAECDLEVDPDSTARPLQLREDLDTVESGREFLWQLVLSEHPELNEFIEMLQTRPH